jgi:hypothetical protein
MDEAIALAWVHGVEVRPFAGQLSKVTPIWRALDRFGVVNARWRPYWSEAVAICDRPQVKVSAWTRKGKALLVVSHLERKPATVQLRLDRRQCGLPAGPLRARDALTAEVLAVNGDNVEMASPGMSCRFVELGR